MKVCEAPLFEKTTHIMALYRDAKLVKSKLEMLLLATMQPSRVFCWHHMPRLNCSSFLESFFGGYTQTNQTQQKQVCRPPAPAKQCSYVPVLFVLFFIFCFLMFYACRCKFLLLFELALGLEASSHCVYSVASRRKVGARIRVDVCNEGFTGVC